MVVSVNKDCPENVNVFVNAVPLAVHETVSVPPEVDPNAYSYRAIPDPVSDAVHEITRLAAVL